MGICLQRTVVCREVRHLEQQNPHPLLMLCSSFQTFFSLCHVLAFPKQSNFLPSTFQMGLLKSWLSSTYHTPENLLLAALRIVFFGLKYKSTCLIYSTVFFHRDHQSGLTVRSISIWQKTAKMPCQKFLVLFKHCAIVTKALHQMTGLTFRQRHSVSIPIPFCRKNKTKSWQKM